MNLVVDNNEERHTMLTMWVTVGLSGVIAAGTCLGLRRLWRHVALPWRLLSLAGVPLVVMGAVLALRFWQPTAGPYRVGALYPYGPHVAAWQVSLAFTWIAYGVLFFGATLLVGDRPAQRSWAALLVSWMLFLLPHAGIALGFALAGQNEPNVADYQARVAHPGWWLQAVPMGLSTVAFFVLSIVGFGWTGRAVWNVSRSAARKT